MSRRDYRWVHVKHATRVVLDHGFPPEMARRVGDLAGLAWDSENLPGPVPLPGAGQPDHGREVTR